jgi:hypothetical protein
VHPAALNARLGVNLTERHPEAERRCASFNFSRGDTSTGRLPGLAPAPAGELSKM